MMEMDGESITRKDLIILLFNAETFCNGGSALANLLSERRQACSAREYHAVGRESEEYSKHPFHICLDCDAWFGRNDEMGYIVHLKY